MGLEIGLEVGRGVTVGLRVMVSVRLGESGKRVRDRVKIGLRGVKT